MIVLTGGAGFIGSCLLKKFNDEGINDILVIDNLGSLDKWKNLVGKKYIGYSHKDDFRLDLMNGFIMDEISTIVHLGACTVTTEQNADYMMDNNLNYSIDLARFAAEHDIRFIYASSAATYGNGSNGYSDDDFDTLKPLNIYGYSKHVFDQWVISNNLVDSFVGLKFFNVFGPNEYHKGAMSSMVYKSYKQIKETGRVRLFKSNDLNYNDGEQKRDFVYVKDVVDLIFKIIQNQSISGIFNLGSGEVHTWNELVLLVFHSMSLPIDVEYIEIPDSLKGQYQNYTKADINKILSIIPHNFMEFQDSVRDYVEGYLIKEEKYL